MSDSIGEPDGGAPHTDDERVLSVHFGRSANCSSIGSVIDVLFVSGVVGTALLASIAVLLGARDVEASAHDTPDAKRGDEPTRPAPDESDA